MKEDLFFLGIKGLIRNKQGQILLLQANVSTHRYNTDVYWDIPGGRIERGSTPLETLKREISEEIQISEINGIEALGMVISNHRIPTDSNLDAGLILSIYTCTIPDDQPIQLSEEHTDFIWATPEKAARLLAHKYPPEFTETIAKL